MEEGEASECETLVRGLRPARRRSWLSLADAFIRAVRATSTVAELATLMDGVCHELGFRHYALIHHDDLRQARPDRVDIRLYPEGAVERLIGQSGYRRDPIIRGCIFSDSAFLWSDLHRIIRLDRQDRACFEHGVREGLNEGITVPHVLLGECMGSCTFAGTRRPQLAERYLGPAQMIGVFAFQAARRLLGHPAALRDTRLRLHPRPRDCVVLAGRGKSNKEIARQLGLTPRTVDGYLTEARRIFDAHDRTELVISAILAGEVGLHELKPDQPE